MSVLRARNLRSRMTDAETRLWSRLRNRKLDGYKFRRQMPLGKYVTDFACEEAKLIVELDGGQHCGSDYDDERTLWLENKGWQVIRFWNNEVFENFDAVIENIQNHLVPTAQNSDQPIKPLQGRGLRSLSPSGL